MNIYKYIKKNKFILLLILIIIVIIVFFIINKLFILNKSNFIDFNEFNNNNKILIIGNFHSKNESGLKKILEYLKIEHKFSDINNIKNDIDNYNIIYSPNQAIDSSVYLNKKFIFGPHFSVFPEDSLLLINNKFNNSIYIQPSEWAANTWINKLPEKPIPIKVFPFPVNTDKFKPLDNISNNNNIYIYFKRRKPEELEYLETFLKKQNINYKIFDYFKTYKEIDYLNYLQTCKYGIILGAHESQGFAIQEALSTNIPLLVWSASSMNQEHGSNYEDIPCISVPYWDNRCGEIFYKDIDLENTFNKFIKNLHNYSPRQYILDNLSTEKCSERFINLINSINTNTIEKYKNLIYNDDIIPKTIYLCYKNKNIPRYIIPNWQKLNPNYNIILYDNQDCINFLKKNYGEEYVNIFNFIKDGPIKADFWRCCILFKYGGVYADIDTKPVMPLDNLIETNLELLTVRSCGCENCITPELIICKKNNKLLDLCIKTYINYMNNKKQYSYWDWSICGIMKDNFKFIIKENIIKNKSIYLDDNNKKYKLIDEISDPESAYKDRAVYNNEIVLYNRYEDYNKDDHTF